MDIDSEYHFTLMFKCKNIKIFLYLNIHEKMVNINIILKLKYLKKNLYLLYNNIHN